VPWGSPIEEIRNREEGRGKREEGRGKREEGRGGAQWESHSDQSFTIRF